MSIFEAYDFVFYVVDLELYRILPLIEHVDVPELLEMDHQIVNGLKAHEFKI